MAFVSIECVSVVFVTVVECVLLMWLWSHPFFSTLPSTPFYPQYYDQATDILKEIITNCHGKEERQLRGRAFECFSLICACLSSFAPVTLCSRSLVG